MISSLKKLDEQKIKIYEVFTPYPLHDVIKILKRKSRLPTAAYFYGLFAIVAVLAFLYYTSVISWPIVYGGKPFNSFPSFIVITIVLTIFTVTITSLATFSARSKLYPGQVNPIFHEEATDDKFVVVLSEEEVDESTMKNAESLMKSEGAIEVLTKSFDENE
jgi:hypothetical protein